MVMKIDSKHPSLLHCLRYSQHSFLRVRRWPHFVFIYYCFFHLHFFSLYFLSAVVQFPTFAVFGVHLKPPSNKSATKRVLCIRGNIRFYSSLATPSLLRNLSSSTIEAGQVCFRSLKKLPSRTLVVFNIRRYSSVSYLKHSQKLLFINFRGPCTPLDKFSTVFSTRKCLYFCL